MFSKRNIPYLTLLAAFAVVYYMSLAAEGAPQPSPEFYSPQLSFERNPEYLLQTLARLRQALVAEEDLENSKRGLDLGLSRGYSGSQAAKHLMGLAAANFAGGPGRRRRNNNED